jgi:hypothetical protein
MVRRWPAAAPKFWLGLWLCLVPLAAAAAEFVFERVEVGLEGEFILVDADVRYDLSDAALEALAHGVPLTFELHVQLRRADAWVWDKDVVETRLRTVLRYHPLSTLYELRELSSDGQQSFATQEAALRALGSIRGFPVARLDRLEAGEEYKLQMHAFLDIDALPLPLRPKAYISPAWDLESETWEWRLQP